MCKLRSYDVGDVRVLIKCASCLRDVHQRGVVEYCVRSQAEVEGFDGEKASIGKGGQTEEHLKFAYAISTRVRMSQNESALVNMSQSES